EVAVVDVEVETGKRGEPATEESAPKPNGKRTGFDDHLPFTQNSRFSASMTSTSVFPSRLSAPRRVRIFLAVSQEQAEPWSPAPPGRPGARAAAGGRRFSGLGASAPRPLAGAAASARR